MKNRKIVVVAFLVVAVMLLGVGYAALTDMLTIIGNVHIDMNKANETFDTKIYFSGAEVKTGTGGTGSQADVASFTADDATFTANSLAVKGEKSTFVFTITNDSNVDAEIVVNPTKGSGDPNPTNSNAEKFSVTYVYPQGQTVPGKGGTITVEVTVEVIGAITEATSATFGIEYNVVSGEEVTETET